MKKIVYLALALSVGAAMPALAMDKHHSKSMDKQGKGGMFEEIDTNRDGVVNWSEQSAFSKKMFRDADTNNDKLLSRDELWDHKRQMREKEFGSFRERGDYSRMSPSSGNERASGFGSRSDQQYDSYKDSPAYEGVVENNRTPSDRPYNKNYRQY